jgi:5-methylcytosine-specific restriction endonuclease McrA
MEISFQYPEDRTFFEELLIGERIDLTITDFYHLFDFRSPSEKRNEYNRIRKDRFAELKQHNGLVCLLGLDCCDPDSGFVIDHLIPISTNKLNKQLRLQQAERGKKVKTQSFGSNHIDNMIIACRKCNGRKMNGFLAREKLWAIFRMKENIKLPEI